MVIELPADFDALTLLEVNDFIQAKRLEVAEATELIRLAQIVQTRKKDLATLVEQVEVNPKLLGPQDLVLIDRVVVAVAVATEPLPVEEVIIP